MGSWYQYPRNVMGIALLALRVSVAALILLDAQANGFLDEPSVISIAVSLICVGLSIGILTLGVGVAGALGEIALLFAGKASVPSYCIINLVLCLVVAVLGAGAYSLDAVLFGRRRVVL